MRVRHLLVALALAAAMVPVGLATSSPAAASSPYKIVFGLNDHWFNNITADDNQISQYGGAYKSAVVGTFLQWDKSTTPDGALRWAKFARSRGAVPMMDLYPPTTVRLASIATGGQDGALRRLASSLKSFGHPFLFRLFPEMNGSYESYAPGTHGQTAGQFVSAWRHVVTLFRRAGATNVKFVWNPNRLFPNQPYSLHAMWPGSSYVNWVALDGYNSHGSAAEFQPQVLLKSTLAQIRKFTTMSLMIAELGVAPYSGKPTWIANSISSMQSLGAKIVCWFNEEPSPSLNWRLNSGPDSTANLKAAGKAIHASYVGFSGRISSPTNMAELDKLASTGNF